MNDLGRRVAIALMLIAVCGACGQRGGGSAATESAAVAEARPGNFSSLPREAIGAARRGEWRTQLMWSGDCEDAFQASHAGDAGGIRVVRLDSAVSVVEVTCAAGSYQPSAVRFALIEDGTGTRSVPLSFPVYSSEDGRQLRLSRETEVWGESVVTAAAGEIAILSLARQTADCGTWTRYSLAGAQPRLLAAAARLQCPNTPDPPVALSGSGPPAGWETIPRKE